MTTPGIPSTAAAPSARRHPGRARSVRSARLLRADFTAWLGATTVSATGDGVLYFALAWAASGFGPGTATLVMTAGLVPEVLLTLVGGAAADRWGPRRTVIGGGAAMALVLAGLAAADAAGLPLVVLLVVASFAAGVVFSFQTPAGNVLPRLFFPEELVGRAMAVTGSVLPLARLVGPPLGAVAVAGLAFGGVLLLDLASFLVVLVVLLAVRPPYEPPPAAAGGSALGDVLAGLRALRAVPGVVPMLASLCLVAGGLLPLLALGVPLLVRERGWVATDAGLVEACWIAGTLAVTVLVARRGTRERPVGPLAGGPLLAALGAVALALAPTPGLACAAAVVMGLGTAVFTTHFFPLYVLRSPADMLGRFQSVLVLVQLGAMLLGNAWVGAAVARWGAEPALLLAAGVCALAAVPVLRARTWRASR